MRIVVSWAPACILPLFHCCKLGPRKLGPLQKIMIFLTIENSNKSNTNNLVTLSNRATRDNICNSCVFCYSKLAPQYFILFRHSQYLLPVIGVQIEPANRNQNQILSQLRPSNSLFIQTFQHTVMLKPTRSNQKSLKSVLR